jgi:hypothetical protein
MKHLKTFESFISEAKDMVTFSVNNDKLDQLLNDYHGRELDYVKIKGDEFYTLPRREFDRFIDAASSKGFEVGYEGDDDSDIYVQENFIDEGVLVEPGRYVRTHGKKPSGEGLWAFQFGKEELFAPGTMKYTDAVKWAKEKAKELKVNVVYVLS